MEATKATLPDALSIAVQAAHSISHDNGCLVGRVVRSGCTIEWSAYRSSGLAFIEIEPPYRPTWNLALVHPDAEAVGA